MLIDQENEWLKEISVSVSPQILQAIERYATRRKIPPQDDTRGMILEGHTTYSPEEITDGKTPAFCFVFGLESIRISLYDNVPRRIVYFNAADGYFESCYIERKQTQKAIRRLLLEDNTFQHQALAKIQDLLDGVAWDANTLDNIARVMMQAGYRIRDIEERDRDDLLESKE